MAQYIDKSALVAEIKRRIDLLRTNESGVFHTFASEMIIIEYENMLSFLDTLEVKEVDLEQEIQQHIKDCLDIKFPTTDVKMIAKDVEYTARMFFELGLKVKGE